MRVYLWKEEESKVLKYAERQRETSRNNKLMRKSPWNHQRMGEEKKPGFVRTIGNHYFEVKTFGKSVIAISSQLNIFCWIMF